MNTALYYFSGTGNSLSITKSIKEQLSTCEIHPIIACLKYKPIEITAQRIGIIFPMHFMSIPLIVREFLLELKFHNPKYVFVIVTGANPRFGNAFSEVEKCLKKSNVELNAGYFIPMVASHFPYIKLSKEKSPDLRYQEAEEKVVSIVESISQLKNEVDSEFNILGDLKLFLSSETYGSKTYFTVGEGCIRCGYCMQVCPFQNIRIHGKHVQWKDNCHHCFACLHYCSQSVIQYKKLSVGKPRNHHPKVSLNDISLQRG